MIMATCLARFLARWMARPHLTFCCFIVHPSERRKTIAITDGLHCSQVETAGGSRTHTQNSRLQFARAAFDDGKNVGSGMPDEFLGEDRADALDEPAAEIPLYSLGGGRRHGLSVMPQVEMEKAFVREPLTGPVEGVGATGVHIFLPRLALDVHRHLHDFFPRPGASVGIRYVFDDPVLQIVSR
jgi:hypothetical protein